MNEQIETVAELDALTRAVGECAEAAIVREGNYGQPWFIVEDEWGQYTAWSYPTDEGDNAQPVSALLERGPLTVIYCPERQPQVVDLVAALRASVEAAKARRIEAAGA